MRCTTLSFCKQINNKNMYEKKNRTVRSSSHGWIYNRKRCESLCNAQEESIFHFNASLHRFSNLICKQTTVMCGGVRHTRKQTRIDHWCALKIFLLHICFGVRHFIKHRLIHRVKRYTGKMTIKQTVCALNNNTSSWKN